MSAITSFSIKFFLRNLLKTFLSQYDYNYTKDLFCGFTHDNLNLNLLKKIDLNPISLNALVKNEPLRIDKK